jgi:hypothetical protein
VPGDPNLRTDERVTKLLAPISQELIERLDLAVVERLGGRDRDAISTALLKAFLCGDYFVRTEIAAGLIEDGIATTRAAPRPLNPLLRDADLWAQEYGDATP